MMNILLGILIIVAIVICYAIGSAVLGAMGMCLFGSFWRVLFTPVIVGFFAILIPIGIIALLFRFIFVLLGWILGLIVACIPFILVIVVIVMVVKAARKRR